LLWDCVLDSVLSVDSESSVSVLSLDWVSFDSVSSLDWVSLVGEPWSPRATALTQSPCVWSPSFGQSWAAEETSAPWLSGCSVELFESGAAGPEVSVDEESVVSDAVDEALVPVESVEPAPVESVSEEDDVELVVGAVSGEPATANAAPPMTRTVTHAMRMAICFFMPGEIARLAPIRYRIRSN